MNVMIHKLAAEFIGTFALVFFGCGSIIISHTHPESFPIHFVPLVFGLIIACMIYTVGHISGAHFNPAVTLGFAIARHFPKQEVVLYWLAQIIGGIFASSLLAILMPNPVIYGATTTILPFFKAVAWEIILTFFLMFVIMAVATDTRAVGTMAGIAIGAVVTLGAYVGGPFTGASMNPARSIGPALFEKTLGNIGIYILGPMIGAILGALLYEWIRCEKKPSDDTHQAKGCC